MKPVPPLPLICCVYIATLVLSFCVGLYSWRAATQFYKLILAQMAIAMLTEFISLYERQTHPGANTVPVFNVYIVLEFILYTLAAGSLLFNGKTRRLVVNILSGAYVAGWSASIYHSGIFVFANQVYTVGGIVMGALFMLVLFRPLAKDKPYALTLPIKLFCVATVLYYCCDIPYFSLLPYLLKHNTTVSLRLYDVNDILNIFRYSLIGISFLLIRPDGKKTIKQAFS